MKADTAARTILLALALVNQILTACGVRALPVEDESVATLITTGFTVGSALIAWWKNNSVTAEAQAADAYLEELRGAK